MGGGLEVGGDVLSCDVGVFPDLHNARPAPQNMIIWSFYVRQDCGARCAPT